ncbi:MAG TPA: hypothetical protein DCQ26_07930 [Marinilabiliales bacterium]|nr:hypothetical protein [Marinilabiliales bacterium]HBO75878.1 hypothetical protein [Marinilabiliales bacterium]HBX83300.1 hypothetical protein [Marinilabiliales bacterium]HBY54012.1 hypothetical protein [Marinilabiliales bacterium]
MIMKDFAQIADSMETLVLEWEPKLLKLTDEVLTQRRNSQKRTIKQIVGHMVDSASNNTHRVVHLQYQPSPLVFPNYATFGNNDRWIAIQNYQGEGWHNLVKLWKYANLHFAHIIRQVNPDKLSHEWQADPGHKITLKEMIEDYPKHFQLHLSEIEELILANNS